MKITWNLIGQAKGIQLDKIGQQYGVKRKETVNIILFGWNLIILESDKKYKHRIIDEIEFIKNSM